MKILITGCRGQLGTELQKQLRCRRAASSARCRSGCARPPSSPWMWMNWTSPTVEATINYIRRHQPETVINCAAFTNVDGCEISRDAAYKVNALGPRNLALAC